MATIEVSARLDPAAREAVVRRGRRLTWATIGYNSLEGVVSVAAGALAGSIALVGFGADSIIELSASLAALWRLRADANPHRRERAERRSQQVIGLSFLALAVCVAWEAAGALRRRQAPEESVAGIVIATASLVVMPLLARAKRRVAAALSSRALRAEARQTEVCMYLSATLLAGLVLRAGPGWWWADPVAALLMSPLIAWEGVQGLRGRHACEDCRPVGIDVVT
jgi:divalent metal cation (Fe/Co/Zn/Cd) transporter